MFYLDPAVNNQPWSEQEDITLIRAHHILGNKWCKLAKHFPRPGDGPRLAINREESRLGERLAEH
jgi:hypothetical protein